MYVHISWAPSTSESSSGRSRPSSYSPSLASETLVSSPTVSACGLSEEPSASSGPSSSAYLPLPTPSSWSSVSFTLAAFRKRGQEVGLFARAADFAAQSLMPSTRCTYDARLAGFLKWCAQSSCDPYTASLGRIADFLVSLSLAGMVLYPLSEVTGRPSPPFMQVYLMARQYLIHPSSPDFWSLSSWSARLLAPWFLFGSCLGLFALRAFS